MPISSAECTGRIGSIFIYILERRVHISSSVVEEKNPVLEICLMLQCAEICIRQWGHSDQTLPFNQIILQQLQQHIREGCRKKVDKNQTSILGSIRKRVKNDRFLHLWGPSWTILGHLDHFGPFAPFLAMSTIMGHLGYLTQNGPFGPF